MMQLAGLRLAIFDELMRGGAVGVDKMAEAMTQSRETLTGAVEWLAYHRLIVAEGGQWRAVHPGLARVQWEMSGPAQLKVECGKRETEENKPAERGQTLAVQRHQVEFFTMAGYRESNGSL